MNGRQTGSMALYGMFGKLTAQPGRRDALVGILLENARRMAEVGAQVYIVNTTPNDPDVVWIVDIWDSKEAHDASLRLDHVRSAITRAMPLLAKAPDGIELTPIDGAGLRER
jgi:quinol monooxygenase YgiN